MNVKREDIDNDEEEESVGGLDIEVYMARVKMLMKTRRKRTWTELIQRRKR